MDGSGTRGGVPHAPLAHSTPPRSHHGSTPYSRVASWGERAARRRSRGHRMPERICSHRYCYAVRAPPACRRAACRTLLWHESRSRTWHVALTEPDIAHNKQNNDDDTDDSEDAHVTLLVLLGTGTRTLCTQHGSSGSPGHGLACNAFIGTSVAPASRAICDILATNVGIMRKSCKWKGQIPQSVPCVAGSVERFGARLQERMPGGIAVDISPTTTL
jgi:hypothetical protein